MCTFIICSTNYVIRRPEVPQAAAGMAVGALLSLAAPPFPGLAVNWATLGGFASKSAPRTRSNFNRVKQTHSTNLDPIRAAWRTGCGSGKTLPHGSTHGISHLRGHSACSAYACLVEQLQRAQGAGTNPAQVPQRRLYAVGADREDQALRLALHPALVRLRRRAGSGAHLRKADFPESLAHQRSRDRRTGTCPDVTATQSSSLHQRIQNSIAGLATLLHAQ